MKSNQKFKLSKFWQSSPVLLAAIGAGCIAPVSSAVGQTASFIEEVVVSARKRDESLNDVPDQVQVFGEQLITDAGIQNVTDVAALTPGLFFSGDQFPGLSVLTLRGISQAINSDAPIAFAVDGVTYANSLLFGQPLFDIQQIEVLRGPQGALYGRNSIGGAINITTKGAAKEPEGNVKFVVAEGREYQLQGSYAAPITDTLSFRVTGSLDDRRGLIDNDVTGEDIDSLESQFVRFNANWEPTDRISVDIRASKQRSSGQGTRYIATQIGLATPDAPQGDVSAFSAEAFALGAENNFLGANLLVSPDDRVFLFQNGGRGTEVTGTLSATENARLLFPQEGLAQQPSLPDTENSYGSGSLKVDVDFDTFAFISITDYTETRSEGATFLQNHILAATPATIAPESTDNFTQEFRFTSTGDTRLRWNTGLFYQKQEVDRSVNIFSLFDRPIINGPAAGGIAPAVNLTNGFADEEPFLIIPTEAENEVFAFFFQFNYDLTDSLELTLAGRYDRDERTLISNNFLNGSPDFDEFDDTFDEFQPKVSLGWDITEDALLYATYSTGFRSGGFNGSANFGDPSDGFAGHRYDAETLDNYELGYKTSWLDGTVQLNGAFYFIDYDNQVQFLFANGGQELVNADNSEVLGVEVELTYRPTANLTVTAGFSYQDTEVNYGDSGFFGGADRNNPDISGAQLSFLNAAAIDSIDELNGSQFIFTPEYNLNLNVQYTGQLNSTVDYVLRAEYQRQGDNFFGIDNAVRVRENEFQPEFDLVNFRAGLETESWRVTAFVNNVTDEFYFVHGFLGRFVGQESGNVTQGSPRQFGLEMEYSF